MHKPIVSLIAAISENRVIGRDNKLPWHIPEDLKRFKEITSGNPVIMGRKTYQSIGMLLPKRLNIIISRDTSFKVEGGVVVSSLEEALRQAQNKQNAEEIFIIGGGQIFEQAIDIADRLYLTVVHTTIEGDAFFPEYNMFEKIIFKQEGKSNNLHYTFITLEK